MMGFPPAHRAYCKAKGWPAVKLEAGARDVAAGVCASLDGRGMMLEGEVVVSIV